MDLLPKNPKRILIVGDSGRGKTTFAYKLSEKLNIPYHSTDDFYWKVKFTEKQNADVSLRAVEEVYKQNEWILEGTTANLIRGGLEKADIIFYLGFSTILSQWWSILKRHAGRKNERLQDLLILLRHVLYKRYSIGYERDKPSIIQMIHPYKSKVVILHSFLDINDCLERLEKNII